MSTWDQTVERLQPGQEARLKVERLAEETVTLTVKGAEPQQEAILYYDWQLAFAGGCAVFVILPIATGPLRPLPSLWRPILLIISGLGATAALLFTNWYSPWGTESSTGIGRLTIFRIPGFKLRFALAWPSSKSAWELGRFAGLFRRVKRIIEASFLLGLDAVLLPEHLSAELADLLGEFRRRGIFRPPDPGLLPEPLDHHAIVADHAMLRAGNLRDSNVRVLHSPRFSGSRCEASSLIRRPACSAGRVLDDRKVLLVHGFNFMGNSAGLVEQLSGGRRLVRQPGRQVAQFFAEAAKFQHPGVDCADVGLDVVQEMAHQGRFPASPGPR